MIMWNVITKDKLENLLTDFLERKKAAAPIGAAVFFLMESYRL